MLNPKFPKSVLYSISARIGGSGLDVDAFETVRGLYQAGILGRAVAYDNRQTEIPARFIRTLRWHPVRLLSGLDSKYYYGAKRQYIDRVTARMLARGGFDLFHGWAGECLDTFRVAKEKGIPTILEIPTWHRNKGKQKPYKTQQEIDRENAPLLQRWRNSLLVNRQRNLQEYDLADLILVLSECARDTFLAAGISNDKLFYLPRGVDIERFTPGEPPSIFRAAFLGALIKRKGVHTLLEAWHRLRLKNAELLLVGHLHDEMKPFMEKFATDSVKLAGFAKNPADLLRTASAHIFPSTCEGSAKVTFEAAACGLPQITTRESGDAVVDGETGLVVPCGDVDALAAAIQRLYDDEALRLKMGEAARKRMVEHFTWDHYRSRLMQAYRQVMQKKSSAI